MDRHYYSKRHFERVTNAGAGNPQLTNAQKCEVWRKLADDMRTLGHEEVALACENLIAEHCGRNQ